MPTTLLVANRGEIARRIIRTARRMGMRAVAAYSEADASLPFVREADEAVLLGPARARDSYLDAQRIAEAARSVGARLVHPGYGFLSEDTRLPYALEKAGIAFVGPPPQVLAALGDKARAKDIAEGAGVPTIEGYRSEDQSDEQFVLAAARIGYPVMIKPVAGGGGIGMQLVEDPRALREGLARARRGASAAFGDDRLLLERAIPAPRHVEVQVLADTHGNVAAFAERDCTLQRRHQKVLEESPSPAVDAALRARLRDAAVAIARAARYVNAGTVEFLLAPDGSFHFIEVNARLQVEHPVTEAVHGIDLVEHQLRIALGERLALDPGEPRGHAVEARLYAEDPAAGFVPSTGLLLHVRWPDGARVDAGYEQGDEVTRHYDPLLAKIVTHGADRAAALDALDAALAGTVVLGVRTNASFLRRLVTHAAVRAARIDTGFIDRELAALAARPEDGTQPLALAAAALIDAAPREPLDPWTALGAWRLGATPAATVALRDGTVRVEGLRPYRALGHTIDRDDAPARWSVDGEPATAVAAADAVWVEWRGWTYEVASAPRERSIDVLAQTDVVAPMPGVVLSVQARGGQAVRRGDLLCVVEAMKMELRVEAPGDGTVRAVLCAPGQQVERGQRLVEFEHAPS